MKCVNNWTKQTMIDHIKTNFKGKSIDKSGECLYRGPNGKKCAVGMFMKDEDYKPKFEKVGVSGIGDFNNPPDFKFPLNIMGMRSLQQIHDNSRTHETLENILNWIERNVED